MRRRIERSKRGQRRAVGRRTREQVGGRDLDAVRAEAADAGRRSADLDAAPKAAAVAEMNNAVERYVGLRIARDLVIEATRVVREERQVPPAAATGVSFAEPLLGEPVAGGVRLSGRGAQTVATMIEDTRDGLLLAFRPAATCCAHAEPLPMLLDDVLVHLDDWLTEAALAME